MVLVLEGERQPNDLRTKTQVPRTLCSFRRSRAFVELAVLKRTVDDQLCTSWPLLSFAQKMPAPSQTARLRKTFPSSKNGEAQGVGAKNGVDTFHPSTSRNENRPPLHHEMRTLSTPLHHEMDTSRNEMFVGYIMRNKTFCSRNRTALILIALMRHKPPTPLKHKSLATAICRRRRFV